MREIERGAKRGGEINEDMERWVEKKEREREGSTKRDRERERDGKVGREDGKEGWWCRGRETHRH